MAKEKMDLASMTDADLKTELASLENTYQQMKFDHAVRGLSNPMEIRQMRRDIARILTEGRSRELKAMSAEELELRSKLRARRRRQK